MKRSLNCMSRLILCLVFTCVCAVQSFSAPLERWVYAQSNLAVPAEIERIEALMRRARPLGFLFVLIADSKFARIWDMDARYHANIKRLKDIAKELDAEIVPAVFPVGYSNDLLSNDPNLAEGLPVRDALFVVSNGVARVV